MAAIASANGGRYSVDLHLNHDRSASLEFAQAHVRRLEAIWRGGGPVKRFADGSWAIAPDHLHRVAAYEDKMRQTRPVRVDLLSVWPLEQLVDAEAATWIDRQLVAGEPEPCRDAGFGRQLRTALALRQQWLVEEGFASNGPDGPVYRNDMLEELRRRELLRVAARIADEIGVPYLESPSRGRVAATLERRLDLASGQFAVIVNSREFMMVPWRDSLEPHIGRQLQIKTGSSGISWTIGRGRGLASLFPGRRDPAVQGALLASQSRSTPRAGQCRRLAGRSTYRGSREAESRDDPRSARCRAVRNRTGESSSGRSWPRACSGASGFNHHCLDAAMYIGRLAPWEQRLWSAYNVTPDGGVSKELFAAQMEVNPAATVAPEKRLAKALSDLDTAFSARHGRPLLREHETVPSLLRRAHRFLAAEPDGLLSLSKELTRLFVERVEVDAVIAAISLPKSDKKPGSMKALEKLVAHHRSDQEAATMMAPLFGIYDLRLADAHLGSSKIASGLARAGVVDTDPLVMQGRQLIHAFVHTIGEIRKVLT